VEELGDKQLTDVRLGQRRGGFCVKNDYHIVPAKLSFYLSV